MLKTISPEDAARMLREDGALLVDVREPDEHARARIPGARNVPIALIEEAEIAVHAGKPVIFHCRSGMRTTAHAGRLAAKSGAWEAFAVEGGLEAWQRAGLPVAEDRRRPIEISRQMQIVAGSLVVIGIALGATVSPWLYGIAAFVGAGLTFAGVSGACPMTGMLKRMPWNRAAGTAAA